VKLKESFLAEDLADQMVEVQAYCPPAKLSVCVCVCVCLHEEKLGRKKLNWIILYVK